MEYTKAASDDLRIALIHFGAVSKLSLYDKEINYFSYVPCASTVKDKIIMGYLLFFLITNSLNVTRKLSLIVLNDVVKSMPSITVTYINNLY